MNPFLTRALAAATAALVALTGCAKHEAVPPGPALLVTTGLQQSRAYPGPEDPELVVTVAELRDSRCPRGAVCIWAGAADVTFAVADRSGARQAVALRLFRSSPAADSAVVPANGRRYRLVLHEVNPYPDLTVPAPAPDPQVVFSIKRL